MPEVSEDLRQWLAEQGGEDIADWIDEDDDGGMRPWLAYLVYQLLRPYRNEAALLHARRVKRWIAG